jgi:hypothetical protein
MMKHLSEEQLIEYGYGEGDKVLIEEHFAVCRECNNSYAALQADLAEIRLPDPPQRDQSYGQNVWERLQNRLPAYEKPKRNWLGTRLFRGLSYAAACAILLACAFVGGRLWERNQADTAAKNHPTPAPPAGSHPPQRVVVVVLSDHLDRSERLLVELKHVDADSTEMVSPLRDEARSLLPANRVCRQKAKQNDDPALTGALDHLDRLLAELADEPGGLNKATITRLQDEMNKNGLLFEVRVLRSRIPHAQGAGADSSKGGTI